MVTSALAAAAAVADGLCGIRDALGLPRIGHRRPEDDEDEGEGEGEDDELLGCCVDVPDRFELESSLRLPNRVVEATH